MKINPSRYETTVAASVAEGPSEVIASIKSCYVSNGLTIMEKDEIIPTSRISIEAVMEFPEIFKGHTFLAELTAVEDVKLWDDIDQDYRCLGCIDWFGESSSTLHLAAHLSLDAMQQLRYLLLGSGSGSKQINATAIGLRSIEFQKRELPKGVAVTNVSVSVNRTLDEAEE